MPSFPRRRESSFDLLEMFKVNRYFKLPDSCFRGNGDMTVFNFNLL
ncbi:Uncharacterised protein [Neisseria meningitidis]|nr:Uncharacterised protein [Neisseria meningitidis]